MEVAMLNICSQLDDMRRKINELNHQIIKLKSDVNKLKASTNATKHSQVVPYSARKDLVAGQKYQQTAGEIRNPSEELELEFLKLEMEALKKRTRIPVEGESMGGRSVQRISKRIPTSLDTYRTSLVILISNFLNTPLTTPQHYFSQGSVYNESVQEVKRFTREIICLRAYFFPVGLCSFRIGSTNLRVAIQFDTEVREHGGRLFNNLSLTFLPANQPHVDEILYRKLASDVFTPGAKKKFHAYGSPRIERIIQYEDYYVRVSISQPPRSILEFEIMSRGQGTSDGVSDQNSPNNSMRLPASPPDSLQNGNVLEGKEYDEVVKGNKHSCVVELINILNVPLDNFRAHIPPTGSNYVLPTPEIAACTREMFYVLNDSNIMGMIAYGISSTDLSFVLVFTVQPQPQGNSFAMAFTSEDKISMSDKTFSRLCDSSSYLPTLPSHKFANAKQGEQVIKTRNVLVSAQMTEGEKARLKVTVSSF